MCCRAIKRIAFTKLQNYKSFANNWKVAQMPQLQKKFFEGQHVKAIKCMMSGDCWRDLNRINFAGEILIGLC